jgi:tRNA-specific 2-thiouridylase
MSGGVDSSVAALLLRKRGHDVVGLTMKVTFDESRCCGPEQVLQARRVADFLDIPHVSVDLTPPFHRTVIDPFVKEYLAGRTPNPCVLCNRGIKFGALLSRARDLDCEVLATGHYARIEHDGRHRLLRASDREKSQAYFLAMLEQESLARAMFPLGELEGDEVRRLAEASGLPLEERRSSQEICFVPDEGHAAFIAGITGTTPGPGPLIDTGGTIVGEHAGYVRYTIGQRKGLGVAFGTPRYVVDIVPERNTVVIGEEKDLYSPGFIAVHPNWIALDRLDGHRQSTVKIRYGAEPVPATIWLVDKDTVEVTFEVPQKAVAPGQLAVFYDKDLILGGAWIEHRLDPIAPVD